jgi:D-sedoheptulose 7-phosphate isomerase
MRLADAIRAAGKVLICGNGGSYANAVHIANDLQGCGICAITLDPATLTASANDFGYDTVFARWIAATGRKGDLLIVLSGSGRSPNILEALKTAKARGMTTFAIVGAYNRSTHAHALADHTTALGNNMQEAEEMQIWLGHEVMRTLKKESTECAQ